MREREMRFFTREEAQRFLAAAVGERLEALHVVPVTTGMRQGELLALRWQEVDLGDLSGVGNLLVLRVRATLQRDQSGALMLSETKTKRSRRQIAQAALAVEALRRHRVAQHHERLLLGAAWHEQGIGQDLVFCGATGGPLDASGVYHAFCGWWSVRVCRASGSTICGIQRRRCCWGRG
ncbi:MAG: hypothetical protein OJF49_000310 [Ktedonobacterales bacterium]|nr:MAG: hypothetical protein OJF49_000310 [Ktedonobacterales bacterium]